MIDLGDVTKLAHGSPSTSYDLVTCILQFTKL